MRSRREQSLSLTRNSACVAEGIMLQLLVITNNWNIEFNFENFCSVGDRETTVNESIQNLNEMQVWT